eukprot:1834307-Amphidinium_carterae.1
MAANSARISAASSSPGCRLRQSAPSRSLRSRVDHQSYSQNSPPHYGAGRLFICSVASTLDARRFAHIQLITSSGGYLASSVEEVSVNHKTPNDNYNGNENMF